MRPRFAPATYMNIEEQLALYPELSSDERHAVELYVAAHPELKPALAEARKWDRLLGDVRSLGEDASGDEALAYYITTRGLQPDRAPATVTDFVNRIEQRIQSDPALAARVAEMESKIQALEEGSPASEQFERLRKRHRPPAASESTTPARRPARDRDRDRAAASAREAPAAEVYRSERNGRSADAAAGDRSRSASTLRRAAAGVIAAAVIYGALFVAGDLARPSYERIAEFDDDELSLDGYENVRGEDLNGEPQSPAEYYVGALMQLRNAQTSILGLFPGYDDTRLDSAAALLRTTLEYEQEGSFLAGEATFLLGKTELARGNVEAAREAFSRVIASGARKAPEARRLLEEMRS